MTKNTQWKYIFSSIFLRNNLQIKQDKSESSVKDWRFSLGLVVQHKYCDWNLLKMDFSSNEMQSKRMFLFVLCRKRFFLELEKTFPGYVGEWFLLCLFSPWIWSSEQKESLLKSAAQTRCVKWELPGCDFSGKHPLAIVCPVNFCRPQHPDFHTWEIKGYQGALEKEGLNVSWDNPVHKILISFAC